MNTKVIQRILVNSEVYDLATGFVVRNIKGLDVFGVTNVTANISIPVLSVGHEVDVFVDIDAWLGAGDYFLLAANAESDGTQCDCWIDAFHFKVVDTPNIFTTSIANLNPDFGFSMRFGDSYGQ